MIPFFFFFRRSFFLIVDEDDDRRRMLKMKIKQGVTADETLKKRIREMNSKSTSIAPAPSENRKYLFI
jgi:hypothetical protein